MLSLTFCILYDFYDEVKNILDNGEDVNKVDEKGWTPLMYACEMQFLNIIRLLVQYGANVFYEAPDGRSPINICACGKQPLIRFLKTRFNIDLDAPNRFGITPLMYAVKYNKLKTIEYLINNNCNINHQSNFGLTPLMMSKKIKTLELLLSYDADRTIKNNLGKTAYDLVKGKSLKRLLNPKYINIPK